MLLRLPMALVRERRVRGPTLREAREARRPRARRAGL